ncbi:MAG: EamA family transporter [SAR86 cluster bacterium]|uniref:EamA family transporter n=1 Tax=SAR86 cluster bacterium TaxID=2030880 RepID=A0A2A5AUT4_9GAMM|nr:MAG: EamA family transporter [SAR86 cluster bacterium]
MHSPTQKNIAGFFLSLSAAIMWGMLPVALKELLAGMDAVTIVWYRFLFAGLVLFSWLAYRGRLPQVMQTSVRVRWFLLIAATGLCINYFLFSYSLNFVNGETSEAVIQLTTLFLILGGVIIYKESFLLVQKIGTGLIVLGLLLFFNDRLAELGNFDNRETIGVLILVLAAITWTVYALLQKQLLAHFSSVQILFFIYVFSILVLLPLISPASLFQLTQLQFFLLLFCCINTLVAYGCFAEALNCWEASKVSAVLALAPLFTISSLKLVVFLFPDYQFSDRLGLLSLAGASLLVIGSVLTAVMPALVQKRKALRLQD